MRVSFCTVSFSPQNFRKNTNADRKLNVDKNLPKTMLGDLGMSIGVGVVTGGIVAEIMRYKKLPNIFSNSFNFGSIFAYLTYMGTLIATPFRE